MNYGSLPQAVLLLVLYLGSFLGAVWHWGDRQAVPWLAFCFVMFFGCLTCWALGPTIASLLRR